MPISALPTPPSRSDSPQDFSDRADALLGALPGFVTEANALQSDVNAKEASVSSYATIATDKAAEAQASATTASTKASEAAASAVAAAAAASNAEIAFDSFDDKYLGSKSADPATDNDGNPLLTGALYWNTTVGAVRVWNGSSWLSMAADASIVDFQQAGAGAVVRTAQDKMRDVVSVKDFGAVGDGGDESSAAIAMIAAHNYLYVPQNFTLTCKNIELFNGIKVICDGALKLPNNCIDFDRLLYAEDKTNIEIDIRELDGNYAGQSANIGTHLIYVTNCDDISIKVKYAHDHYAASDAPMPSVDGIRDASSGGIFLYGTDRGKITVGLFEGWSREAVQLRECRWCEISLGHAQGKYLTEYSGLQVSGAYNAVNRASVDFAGASAVGFDTQYGTLSNVIATNTRENHGVNFGHAGYPATGSVAENIVVDGAYLQGIQVSASSHDVTVNNFSIQNTGVAGISFSDGVLRGKATNGVVSYPGNWSVGVYGAELTLANVRTSDRDSRVVTVSAATGLFTEGETVTTAGGSAVVRKRVQNLTGAKQRLFFTSVTGTFSVAEVMTGGTSGATATVETVSTPVEYYEDGGGQVLRDPRYFTGSAGNQIRFPDGTAIMTISVPCALTTGGVHQDFTTNYSSNVVWASAPMVTVSIASVTSTNGYTVTLLRGSSTTTALSIALNATVAQTYNVHAIAIGRWK